jgi:hypothetical protein
VQTVASEDAGLGDVGRPAREHRPWRLRPSASDLLPDFIIGPIVLIKFVFTELPKTPQRARRELERRRTARAIGRAVQPT